MLVDVFSKGITGKVAEAALGKAGITVNKNAIPFDQNPPMVASGIRIGTPAVTTRGMREAEMDLVGELIARALKTPDDDRALAMVRAEVERLCRKFPLYPEAAAEPLSDPRAVFGAPAGPLARAVPDFEPRAGQVEMAAAVARVFERGRRPARRGRHRHRQDARLSRAGDPEPPARAHLDRHQEPAGTDLLQGHSRRSATALGIPFTATYMKGRANYLCLHKLDQLTDGAGPAVHDVFLPIIREWSARTDTGDRAELEDLPEDLPFWNEVSATAETCLGTECPRYDDCFVTQHAPARRRVRRRHRQPSSAVRRRRRPPERVRRGHPRLQPRDRRRGAPARRHRHAVLRLLGEHLPAGRLRARRGASHGVGRRTRRGADTAIAKAPSRQLRDHARAFFTELAFAHRTERPGVGAAKSAFAPPTRRSARPGKRPALTGALDVVEATLALADQAAREDEPEPAPGRITRRSRGARARSATTCGSCCGPAIRPMSTSSSSAARASFCARRRSTCRRSSASCCSIACGRRC